MEKKQVETRPFEGILKGTWTLREVEEYLGGMKLVEKSIDDSDLNLKHPSNGTTLKATKGYYNDYYTAKEPEGLEHQPFKRWHYIEYSDPRGIQYSYISRNGNDIGMQNQRELDAAAEGKKEETKQQDIGDSKIGRFREEMADKKTNTEGGTHTDAHELGRRDFTSSMRTTQSQTSPQSNEAAKRNFANHMNGSGGSATPQTSSQAHSEGSKNGIHR